MNDLINLKCTNCGAPLENKGSYYFCPYCDSRYENKNHSIVRVETYTNPIRVLATKCILSNEAILTMGAERSGKFVKRHMAEQLATSIAELMEFESAYDPHRMEYLFNSRVRIVEPKYRYGGDN